MESLPLALQDVPLKNEQIEQPTTAQDKANPRTDIDVSNNNDTPDEGLEKATIIPDVVPQAPEPFRPIAKPRSKRATAIRFNFTPRVPLEFGSDATASNSVPVQQTETATAASAIKESEPKQELHEE